MPNYSKGMIEKNRKTGQYYIDINQKKYELYPDLAQYLLNTYGMGESGFDSGGSNYENAQKITSTQQFKNIVKDYTDKFSSNYNVSEKKLLNIPDIENKTIPTAETGTTSTVQAQNVPINSTTTPTQTGQQNADGTITVYDKRGNPINIAQDQLQTYLNTGKYSTTNPTQTGTLPQEQGDIIDLIADAVGNPDATDEEILTALDKLKLQYIDPYYQQVFDIAKKDIIDSINTSYQNRLMELENEKMIVAKNIEDTRKNLEARGMTFSGEAIKQLGQQSAFGQSQETSQELRMTPEQLGIEGITPTVNRLMAESSSARYKQLKEQLAKNAVLSLGTSGITGLDINNPYTGQKITGSIEESKRSAIQDLYRNLQNQSGNLTEYQKLFY